MCSRNNESKSCGRGARQVHLYGGAASGECVVGVGRDVPKRGQAGAPIWRSRCHAHWCDAIAVGRKVYRAIFFLLHAAKVRSS